MTIPAEPVWDVGWSSITPKKQQGGSTDYGFNYNFPAHHMEQPEGEVIIIVIIIIIIIISTTHLKNFQIFSLLISQTPGDDLCFAASIKKGSWQKPSCFNSL